MTSDTRSKPIPHYALIDARVTAGITQYEVAYRARISQAQYYNYEAGYRIMTDEVAERIATILGVPVETLMQPPTSTPTPPVAA